MVACVGDEQLAGRIDREASRLIELGVQSPAAVAGKASTLLARDKIFS
jgi:hypothetical protein